MTEPTEPAKDGYSFGGWYSDAGLSQAYTFSTMSAEDITLYAQWDIITYDITYNLDGGTNVSNPSTYTVETPTITLIIPTKEGHTLNGWFDNAEFAGDAVTQITLGTINDITLYAKWTINQYNINFNTYDNYDAVNDIALNAGETIIQVSLGYDHSSAITSEGRIFTWGDNGSGRLGDGTNIDRNTPTEITNQFNLSDGEIIIHVSLGYNHSSAITSEGRLFLWGRNDRGQLGNGVTLLFGINSTPIDITSQFNLNDGEIIIQVSLGYAFSSAITSEGRIFTWGFNIYGQLGDGTTTNRSIPNDITSQFNLINGEGVVYTELGSSFSSAITSEGRVFSWGLNNYGRLGDGTTAHKSTPTEITNHFNLYPGESVKQIFLFEGSSAVTSKGRIFTWGYNVYGLIGLGIQDTYDHPLPIDITSQFNLHQGETIVQVTFGHNRALAITSEGRVFSWGQSGTSIPGTELDCDVPTDITSQFELYGNEIIIQISLGYFHSSALTSEGRIFTWGINNYGQLGDGTTFNRTTPTVSNYSKLVSSDLFIYNYNEIINEYSPTRIGYLFTGWYSDPGLTQLYTFTTMPAEDITLYANWIINQYTITFDSNEGSVVEAITQDYATTLTEPTESTRKGYTFAGWYSDAGLTQLYIFTTMTAEDITLYAKWIQNE